MSHEKKEKPTPAEKPSAKLTVEFRESKDGITIVRDRRRPAGGGLAFVSVWLFGWTCICAALVWLVAVGELSVVVVAFAIPFWAGWIAVSCYLVWILFGKEYLEANSVGVCFERHALIRFSTREVLRKEMLRFRQCEKIDDDGDSDWGIELENTEEPLHMFFELPEEEREWLVLQLNNFYGFSSNVQLASDGHGGQQEVEVLNLASTNPLPPRNCKWSKFSDARELEFQRYGKFSKYNFFGLLVANLFWNGIVLFALVSLLAEPGNDLPRDDWWLTFAFLIPFELFGLLFLYSLLRAVCEPFHQTTWTLDKSKISRQSLWPWIRSNKKWHVKSIDRLELRKCNSRQLSRRNMNIAHPADYRFELVFVSAQEAKLCAIEGLTRGEALWMGHHILKSQSHWFITADKALASATS